jgi:hypothetical protein
MKNYKLRFSLIILFYITLYNAIAAPTPRGWKYLGADVGGAFSWGMQLTPLGGPMGTALGIVVGGTLTSTWSFYWDHNNYKLPITLINDEFTNQEYSFANNFKNEYEKTGYLHNTFIKSFINNHQQYYLTEEAFVDAVYEPLLIFIADEFKISKSQIEYYLSKSIIVELLKKYSVSNSIEDNERIINESYGNTLLSSEYRFIMDNFKTISDEQDRINFIDFKISQILVNQNYSKQNKEILNHSLNLLKYSYCLWSLN